MLLLGLPLSICIRVHGRLEAAAGRGMHLLEDLSRQLALAITQQRALGTEALGADIRRSWCGHREVLEEARDMVCVFSPCEGTYRLIFG